MVFLSLHGRRRIQYEHIIIIIITTTHNILISIRTLTCERAYTRKLNNNITCGTNAKEILYMDKDIYRLQEASVIREKK